MITIITATTTAKVIKPQKVKSKIRVTV